MLNCIARILLTSTALAPVGLTYAWVAWFQGYKDWSIGILGACALLVLLCVLILEKSSNLLSATDFKTDKIEAADHENTAFLLLYVMPLFTSKLDSLDWQFWIPTLVIFGLITATGYNYHFNPLLSLLRWHFYKVESPEGVTYILITKKHLRSAATSFKIVQLTEYIILDTEGR